MITAAAAAAALAVAPGASARSHASHPAAPTPPAPTNGQISNERTLTRWAYSLDSAPIYAAPDAHSRKLSKLHLWTEDGFPEVYIALRASETTPGVEWIQIRIPMRPNGRVGWVHRDDLGDFHVTRQQIVVNRARLRMYLFDNGKLRWSAPVGVGQPSMPTPAGRFWIREKFKVSSPSSGYWPYAFGTADYSTLTDWPGGGVVGIHGPYYAPPGAIPGRISHGCIRLRTGDDGWLGRHVGVGVPLRVV